MPRVSLLILLTNLERLIILLMLMCLSMIYFLRASLNSKAYHLEERLEDLVGGEGM